MSMNPQHPIYVVSHKRADSMLTCKALTRMHVPFYLIIEPSDYEDYQRAILASSDIQDVALLTVPEQFHDDYETCDHLGRTKSQGPGPARNYAWDQAIKQGAKWHWVMDDNIRHFYRFNRNTIHPALDGTIFRCMEDFCDRYQNVLMAGPNYEMFITRKNKWPPVVFNTRIYSCNLIRNDAPWRWRGRYNEDTDLSLRMLKACYCTVQFNAFLQGKIWTQVVKGGNDAEFYSKEGTLPKSRMLVNLHPDVARVVWRFNRWHHVVNYKPFAHNKLIPKEGAVFPRGINNYGMVLRPKNTGGH